MTGASQVHLQQLIASNTNFALSGASSINFNGLSKADKLQLDASGASHFNGNNFEVKSADIELSGASTCEVYATDSLAAKASGASHIQYRGNPKTTFSSKASYIDPTFPY